MGESLEQKYNQIINSINSDGFKIASNLYSVSETSNFGGKIGWVNTTSMSGSILDELEKLISEREPVIEKKEELSQSPDCFVEVPFDKSSAPATLASLEAVVLATIRVYLAEFSILSMPILSAILLGEENYDELLPEFIVHKMRDGMTKEGSFFVSTYEKYTYDSAEMFFHIMYTKMTFDFDQF